MEGFDWDNFNINKNWQKHNVTPKECEQVFFNKPLMIYQDAIHSQHEIRYTALGRSDEKRRLIIAFTVRGSKIRIISARDQSQKERILYETIHK